MPSRVDDRLLAVGALLHTAAKEAEAYGLAAVHIGEIAPIVVISGAETGPRDHQLLYNPQVTAVAGKHEWGEEGSVSMPGVRVEIARPVWAEIAFEDDAGRARTLRLEGFAARVALHEIEQMQGIFFLDHLSRLKREIVVKKFRKADRPG